MGLVKETPFVNAVRTKIKEADPHAFIVKMHGGGYQQKGLPDLYVATGSRSAWIEAKSLKKPKRPTTSIVKVGTFTAIQVETIRRINRAGGTAFGLVLVGDRVFRITGSQLYTADVIGLTFDALDTKCTSYPWPVRNARTFTFWLTNDGSVR